MPSDEDSNSPDSENETPKKETKGQMMQRHKREAKELKGKTDSIMHSFNKKDTSAKKKAEEEVRQLEEALKKRHAAEQAALDNPPPEPPTAAVASMSVSASEPSEEQDGEAAAPARGGAVGPAWTVQERKLTKSQRRKVGRAAADAERERQIAEEKLNTPSQRALELQALRTKIKPLGLRVKEIPSDGHCLYRALADQLEASGRPVAQQDGHLVLRRMAADFMRTHPDDFAPFINADADGSDDPVSLEEYCNTLASTAAWGGQLEILALSKSLHVPVTVHSAAAPPVKMGDEFNSAPLHVAFHRHAFGLGEHYNSLVPFEEPPHATEDVYADESPDDS